MINILSDELISILADFCEKNVGAFDFQEMLISDIFREIVKLGDVVVDGGAHTGRHTHTLASLTGVKGRVYAFEPLPALAAGLANKFQPQPHIMVIPKALSNVLGKTSFIFVKNNPSYSGMHASNRLADAENVEIEVETTTLDHCLANETSCRLIKLDVEGAEYMALSGALSVLERFDPLVLLENDLQQTATRYGYSRQQFFDIFIKTRYRLFDITGVEITEEHWSGQRPHFDNFIAAKRPEDIHFIQKVLPRLLFSVLLQMNEVTVEIGKSIFRIMNWIAGGQKVVLFGAGNRARLILENYAVPFSYAVDNDSGKAGTRLGGIDVFVPAKLLEEQKDLKIVIISLWGEDIQKQLIEMGFSPSQISRLNIR